MPSLLGALGVEENDVVGVGRVFVQHFQGIGGVEARAAAVGNDRVIPDNGVERLAQGGAGFAFGWRVIAGRRSGEGNPTGEDQQKQRYTDNRHAIIKP